MASWTLELGEFSGGFRTYRDGDTDAEGFLDKRLTFLKATGMWQASAEHEPIEVGRLVISQDGVEIVGGQVAEDLAFVITVEFQYHIVPLRRIEEYFTSEDIPHIGDKFTVTRSDALPNMEVSEVLGLEVPPVQWKGEVDNLVLSPIMHEALYGDFYEMYDVEPPRKEIRFKLIGEKE